MTAVTAGEGRFVKRDAALNVITGSESRSFQLTELDNTASPRIILNDPESAASDDILSGHRVKVDGRKDESLEFQVSVDTGDTADTGDGLALLHVQAWLMINGKWTPTEKQLRLADRITPAGGAGITDPRGLADDGQMVAGQFSPYLRFAPGPNEVWILRGHQRVTVHDDTP